MPGIQPQARDKRDAISVVIILGVLFMASVTAIIFLHGFYEAQHQYQVAQTYAPVEAKVISSEVRRHHSSRSGTDYTPEVTYQYQVNGVSYQSSELRAAYVSSDQDWANDIVSRYRPGQPCRAFYDPSKPDQAVLIRGYSFSPYFEMLEGAFSVSVVLYAGLTAWFSRKRKPVPADNGWFDFFPEYSQKQHLTAAQLSTAIWYGLGAVTAFHLFHYVPPPHTSYALHMLMAFAVVGLIPAGFVLRYYRVIRNLSAPRLLLNRSAPAPGDEFRFTISQQARRQLTLTSVNVWLNCIATTVKGKRRTNSQLLEEHPIALRNHPLHAGEPLELSGALTIPPDLPITGRNASRGWINWDITLQCKIKGAPAYETKFPVMVTWTPVEDAPRPADLPARAQVQVQDIASPPAARILSKGHVAVMYVVGMWPVFLMFAGMAAMFVSYPTAFHDNKFPATIALPANEALPVFIVGIVVTLASSILGLIYPGTGGAYLRRVAVRTIRQRPGAIVSPEAKDSLFVDVVPRSNWNRMMLENAADIGFLVVDLERREIRFEGDRQRYRIPAESMCSCTLEKSLVMQSASPDATGYWMVVVRAYDAHTVWEAPFAIRPTKGRGFRRFPSDATKELHARISLLLPKSTEQSSGLLRQT